ERQSQRVDDRRFESGRRQAMNGRGAAIAGLHGRGRDVIAIANATLDRVGGRQSLASFIKELATEKRCGLQPGDASDTLLLKAPLNFLERLGIDDGRMLPRPGSPVVVDLAEIMPVAQDVGERAIGQMNAANRLAGRQRTNPGPDVSPLQFSLERANRPEFE